MFTSLNNILGLKPPRHAEQNDTRQDIQRHDPDHERRRRKKQTPEEELFADEEGATVSVEALTLFLNKFLKELTEKPKKGFNATSRPEEEKPAETIETQPSLNPAAQAANAYQNMAQSQQKTSLLDDINEHNADLISLDGSEVRIIHSLLKDLKLLSDKNIEYIHIERASSFLQSLVNAVDTVKKSSLFKG